MQTEQSEQTRISTTARMPKANAATMTDAETIAALNAKCALLAASLKQAEAQATKSAMDAVKEVFGRGPDEVLLPVKIAEEVLDWLEILFETIKQLAAERDVGNRRQIEKFSALGAYLASDCSNTIGCEKERMVSSINGGEEVRVQHER